MPSSSHVVQSLAIELNSLITSKFTENMKAFKSLFNDKHGSSSTASSTITRPKRNMRKATSTEDTVCSTVLSSTTPSPNPVSNQNQVHFRNLSVGSGRISTDTPIDIYANMSQLGLGSLQNPSSPQNSVNNPAVHFDPDNFQNNICGFLQEKFDSFEEKRERDRADLYAQIKSTTTRKKNNKVSFKYKSNEIQYEFLSEVTDLVEEARDLCDAGSKKRLTKKLDDISNVVDKRIKVVKLADKSPAGWDTVKEYLNDDLASDSDDNKKMRQAESRAMAKRKKVFNQTRFKPYQRFRHHSPIIPSFVPSASMPQAVAPSAVLPQPFLGQGAFGARAIPSMQIQRFSTPANVCFQCGQPGHWKHSCPAKGKQ